MIESEGHMDTGDVVLKNIPPMRVVQLSAHLRQLRRPDIEPANLSPLYPQLMERMERPGCAMAGAPIAYYRPAPSGPGDETITVHAAFPFGRRGRRPTPGFEVVGAAGRSSRRRRAAPRAHVRGVPDRPDASPTWIEDNGYRAVGDGDRPRGLPGLPAR